MAEVIDNGDGSAYIPDVPPETEHQMTQDAIDAANASGAGDAAAGAAAGDGSDGGAQDTRPDPQQTEQQMTEAAVQDAAVADTPVDVPTKKRDPLADIGNVDTTPDRAPADAAAWLGDQAAGVDTAHVDPLEDIGHRSDDLSGAADTRDKAAAAVQALDPRYLQTEGASLNGEQANLNSEYEALVARRDALPDDQAAYDAYNQSAAWWADAQKDLDNRIADYTQRADAFDKSVQAAQDSLGDAQLAVNRTYNRYVDSQTDVLGTAANAGNDFQGIFDAGLPEQEAAAAVDQQQSAANFSSDFTAIADAGEQETGPMQGPVEDFATEAVQTGDNQTVTPSGQPVVKMDDGSGYSRWTLPGADDPTKVLYNDSGTWRAVGRDEATSLQQGGASASQFAPVSDAPGLAADAWQATGTQVSPQRVLAAASFIALSLAPLSLVDGVGIAELGGAVAVEDALPSIFATLPEDAGVVKTVSTLAGGILKSVAPAMAIQGTGQVYEGSQRLTGKGQFDSPDVLGGVLEILGGFMSIGLAGGMATGGTLGKIVTLEGATPAAKVGRIGLGALVGGVPDFVPYTPDALHHPLGYLVSNLETTVRSAVADPSGFWNRVYGAMTQGVTLDDVSRIAQGFYNQSPEEYAKEQGLQRIIQESDPLVGASWKVQLLGAAGSMLLSHVLEAVYHGKSATDYIDPFQHYTAAYDRHIAAGEGPDQAMAGALSDVSNGLAYFIVTMNPRNPAYTWLGMPSTARLSEALMLGLGRKDLPLDALLGGDQELSAGRQAPMDVIFGLEKGSAIGVLDRAATENLSQVVPMGEDSAGFYAYLDNAARAYGMAADARRLGNPRLAQTWDLYAARESAALTERYGNVLYGNLDTYARLMADGGAARGKRMVGGYSPDRFFATMRESTRQRILDGEYGDRQYGPARPAPVEVPAGRERGAGNLSVVEASRLDAERQRAQRINKEAKLPREEVPGDYERVQAVQARTGGNISMVEAARLDAIAQRVSLMTDAFRVQAGMPLTPPEMGVAKKVLGGVRKGMLTAAALATGMQKIPSEQFNLGAQGATTSLADMALRQKASGRLQAKTEFATDLTGSILYDSQGRPRLTREAVAARAEGAARYAETAQGQALLAGSSVPGELWLGKTGGKPWDRLIETMIGSTQRHAQAGAMRAGYVGSERAVAVHLDALGAKLRARGMSEAQIEAILQRVGPTPRPHEYRKVAGELTQYGRQGGGRAAAPGGVRPRGELPGDRANRVRGRSERPGGSGVPASFEKLYRERLAVADSATAAEMRQQGPKAWADGLRARDAARQRVAGIEAAAGKGGRGYGDQDPRWPTAAEVRNAFPDPNVVRVQLPDTKIVLPGSRETVVEQSRIRGVEIKTTRQKQAEAALIAERKAAFERAIVGKDARAVEHVKQNFTVDAAEEGMPLNLGPGYDAMEWRKALYGAGQQPGRGFLDAVEQRAPTVERVVPSSPETRRLLAKMAGEVRDKEAARKAGLDALLNERNDLNRQNAVKPEKPSTGRFVSAQSDSIAERLAKQELGENPGLKEQVRKEVGSLGPFETRAEARAAGVTARLDLEKSVRGRKGFADYQRKQEQRVFAVVREQYRVAMGEHPEQAAALRDGGAGRPEEAEIRAAVQAGRVRRTAEAQPGVLERRGANGERLDAAEAPGPVKQARAPLGDAALAQKRIENRIAHYPRELVLPKEYQTAYDRAAAGAHLPRRGATESLVQHAERVAAIMPDPEAKPAWEMTTTDRLRDFTRGNGPGPMQRAPLIEPPTRTAHTAPERLPGVLARGESRLQQFEARLQKRGLPQEIVGKGAAADAAEARAAARRLAREQRGAPPAGGREAPPGMPAIPARGTPEYRAAVEAARNNRRLAEFAQRDARDAALGIKAKTTAYDWEKPAPAGVDPVQWAIDERRPPGMPTAERRDDYLAKESDNRRIRDERIAAVKREALARKDALTGPAPVGTGRSIAEVGADQRARGAARLARKDALAGPAPVRTGRSVAEIFADQQTRAESAVGPAWRGGGWEPPVGGGRPPVPLGEPPGASAGGARPRGVVDWKRAAADLVAAGEQRQQLQAGFTAAGQRMSRNAIGDFDRKSALGQWATSLFPFLDFHLNATRIGIQNMLAHPLYGAAVINYLANNQDAYGRIPIFGTHVADLSKYYTTAGLGKRLLDWTRYGSQVAASRNNSPFEKVGKIVARPIAGPNALVYGYPWWDAPTAAVASHIGHPVPMDPVTGPPTENWARGGANLLADRFLGAAHPEARDAVRRASIALDPSGAMASVSDWAKRQLGVPVKRNGAYADLPYRTTEIARDFGWNHNRAVAALSALYPLQEGHTLPDAQTIVDSQRLWNEYLTRKDKAALSHIIPSPITDTAKPAIKQYGTFPYGPSPFDVTYEEAHNRYLAQRAQEEPNLATLYQQRENIEQHFGVGSAQDVAITQQLIDQLRRGIPLGQNGDAMVDKAGNLVIQTRPAPPSNEPGAMWNSKPMTEQMTTERHLKALNDPKVAAIEEYRYGLGDYFTPETAAVQREILMFEDANTDVTSALKAAGYYDATRTGAMGIAADIATEVPGAVGYLAELRRLQQAGGDRLALALNDYIRAHPESGLTARPDDQDARFRSGIDGLGDAPTRDLLTEYHQAVSDLMRDHPEYGDVINGLNHLPENETEAHYIAQHQAVFDAIDQIKVQLDTKGYGLASLRQDQWRTAIGSPTVDLSTPTEQRRIFMYEGGDAPTRQLLQDKQNLTDQAFLDHPELRTEYFAWLDSGDLAARDAFLAAHPDLKAMLDGITARVTADDGMTPKFAAYREAQALAASGYADGNDPVFKGEQLYYDTFTAPQRASYDAYVALEQGPLASNYRDMLAHFLDDPSKGGLGGYGTPAGKAWFLANKDFYNQTKNDYYQALRDIATATGADPLVVANEMRAAHGLGPLSQPDTTALVNGGGVSQKPWFDRFGREHFGWVDFGPKKGGKVWTDRNGVTHTGWVDFGPSSASAYKSLNPADKASYDGYLAVVRGDLGSHYRDLVNHFQNDLGGYGTPEGKAWYLSHEAEYQSAKRAYQQALRDLLTSTGSDPLVVANRIRASKGEAPLAAKTVADLKERSGSSPLAAWESFYQPLGSWEKKTLIEAGIVPPKGSSDDAYQAALTAAEAQPETMPNRLANASRGAAAKLPGGARGQIGGATGGSFDPITGELLDASGVALPASQQAGAPYDLSTIGNAVDSHTPAKHGGGGGGRGRGWVGQAALTHGKGHGHGHVATKFHAVKKFSSLHPMDAAAARAWYIHQQGLG